jgi:hypothetical protein
VAAILASPGAPAGRHATGSAPTADPDEAGTLIDQLRTAGITLTCDLDTETLRTGDGSITAVAVGQDRRCQ